MKNKKNSDDDSEWNDNNDDTGDDEIHNDGNDTCFWILFDSLFAFVFIYLFACLALMTTLQI